MKRVMHKTGMIFFVLAISCLIAFGCVFTMNVTESMNKNNENADLNKDIIVDSNANDENSLVAQNADYILKGNCDQIAAIWSIAITDSQVNKRNVKVAMESDWLAKTNANYYTSFGSGAGFQSGTIQLSNNANITLDLNGHTIDRQLTDIELNTVFSGRNIIVNSNAILNIIDSSYDGDEVYKLLVNNDLTQENVNKLPYGKIKGAKNTSEAYGAGIRVENGGVLNFYSGIVCNNTANFGAGIVAMRDGTLNIYDGLIFGNESDNNGGGIVSGIDSIVILKGSIVANNNAAVGAGVFVYTRGIINVRNTIITNNIAVNYGGGIYIDGTCTMSIGVGAQIYGNTLNNKDNNLFLSTNAKVNIWGNLINSEDVIGKYAIHVGVTLQKTSGIFTNGYTANGNAIDPKIYFFSDNKDYEIAKEENEVAVQGSTTSLSILTWECNTINTTEINKIVTYTGEPFTISANGNIYMNRQSSSATSFQVTNVGTYAFYSNGNYSNNVFTLTILPKQVDLIWNKYLTYNGREQKPTAQVIGGIGNVNLSVIVSGGATNVGSNYVARATNINNINYKINPASQNTTFNINPANLQVTAITNNSEAHYYGKEIKLPNNWYTLSGELLGQDRGKSLDSIFDIDYSKIIPQFTKDSLTSDSAVNVGEYSISVKPFNVNEVFSDNSNYKVVINYVNGGTLLITESQVIRPSVESQYEYLVLEEDKRVAYSEKELVHGENDSNVNMTNGKANYYLGNITPNTCVNKFISNLVYDKTQIQIYNNKDEIIYNKGIAEVRAELLDNGIELAIGTGWYIEYSKGGETERITLSVLGDVNGDGRISASDVSYLRQIANDNTLYESLSLEKKLASMVINKGKVTSADAKIVRNAIDKLLTINIFF